MVPLAGQSEFSSFPVLYGMGLPLYKKPQDILIAFISNECVHVNFRLCELYNSFYNVIDCYLCFSVLKIFSVYGKDWVK